MIWWTGECPLRVSGVSLHAVSETLEEDPCALRETALYVSVRVSLYRRHADVIAIAAVDWWAGLHCYPHSGYPPFECTGAQRWHALFLGTLH